MTEEENKKKISVVYKFENFTREAEVDKFGTLRDIRKVLEKQINLSVKQMNIIYHNNNIMNVSETTKIYNYFGDVNEIILELKYKDFVEDDYKLVFEKAFAQTRAPSKTKTKRKVIKFNLKDEIINDNEENEDKKENNQNLKSEKKNTLKDNEDWDKKKSFENSYKQKSEMKKNLDSIVKKSNTNDLPNMKVSKETLIKILTEPISNNYLIISDIGQGSYGQVKKVRHKKLNEIRAMKITNRRKN